MQSIVSYPVRGEGGNARWRGNVAPQLIEDLIDQFHPVSVADPMMGSGTTPDVCRKLNVRCWATDLHQGFDLQKGELPVGFEMWFYHPPYWDIIPYSGNMWASKPDPRDGSHIQNYSEFIAWANENMYRMYEALPQGGLIATLTADVRKKGILYPISMDLARYGETVATVIKVQHNTMSSRKQYANHNFIPIQYEVLVITRKPKSVASYWNISGTRTVHFEFDLRTFDKASWPALVLAGFNEAGDSPTPLPALYEAMQKYARTKIAEQNGIDWRAQVRRILQTYGCFEQVEYGVWRLNKSLAPGTQRVFNNKTN
ncbi:MAG: hypothetical protein L6Q49_13270 [Anaerolineales bacterium]|nr:hypothetical protein [Anaerolineales bacterium]